MLLQKFLALFFEKFPSTDSNLGVQMKSVGESMAIGRNFKESFQKAIRSLELDRYGFGSDGNWNELYDFINLNNEELNFILEKKLKFPNDKRIFYIKLAFEIGWDVQKVYNLTFIDLWFLHQLFELHQIEKEYIENPKEILLQMKKFGFSNLQLAYLNQKSNVKEILQSKDSLEEKKAKIKSLLKKEEDSILNELNQNKIYPSYKLIDTCAGEFQSFTPYFYSTYDEENEALPSNKDSVIVIGSGPNRIGQGIEFDYCCCHSSFALQEMNFESIMVNSNPETVSTDYDISNRLYFEPITFEDILNIYKLENSIGVIIQFGGQTPLKLVKDLEKHNIKILGTSADSIDRAEDRNRFNKLLKKLNLKSPLSDTAVSEIEAVHIAKKIGYPILARPSYVLGGRSMVILHEEEELKSYMNDLKEISDDRPLLIDSFMEDAIEVDVDAICDGEEVLIAGIMEHIEQAGIHSGDSACVFPTQNLKKEIIDEIKNQTRKLSLELQVIGLVNIQYVVKDEDIYVIEVNPRASRTVPFISKALGHSIVRYATLVIMGKKIKDLGLDEKSFIPKNVNLKEVVLPFNKFLGQDILLGPEMRSTGEVMGIGNSIDEAF